MKIYKQLPENVIRLMITKQGCKAQYLTLSECTQDEVIDWLKYVFRFISPFNTGRIINIQVREAIGKENGKSKSIAFKDGNATPEDVLQIITNELSK